MLPDGGIIINEQLYTIYLGQQTQETGNIRRYAYNGICPNDYQEAEKYRPDRP